MHDRLRFSLVIGCAVVGLLSACSSDTVSLADLKNKAHFWQRSDATSAIWQRGPKAQQLLNKDIAQCVVEIRELERLGTIKRAIPNDTNPRGDVYEPGTPRGKMAIWDTPERDGYMRSEHSDYHDFETCMMAKGWERVENVPYNVAETGREVYVETILRQKYRTKVGERDRFEDNDRPKANDINVNE